MGSPPPVWGIQVDINFCGIVIRITPTRVGNTFTYNNHDEGAEDHPHPCGEYVFTF